MGDKKKPPLLETTLGIWRGVITVAAACAVGDRGGLLGTPLGLMRLSHLTGLVAVFRHTRLRSVDFFESCTTINPEVTLGYLHLAQASTIMYWGQRTRNQRHLHSSWLWGQRGPKKGTWSDYTLFLHFCQGLFSVFSLYKANFCIQKSPFWGPFFSFFRLLAWF